MPLLLTVLTVSGKTPEHIRQARRLAAQMRSIQNDSQKGGPSPSSITAPDLSIEAKNHGPGECHYVNVYRTSIPSSYTDHQYHHQA